MTETHNSEADDAFARLCNFARNYEALLKDVGRFLTAPNAEEEHDDRIRMRQGFNSCAYSMQPEIAREKIQADVLLVMSANHVGFQARMAEELHHTFHDMPQELSAESRIDRVAEEAAELFQAAGMSEERAIAHMNRSYARPRGDVRQEVGGLMTTLAAYCEVAGIDMDHERELGLMDFVAKREKVRAKALSKKPGELAGKDPA